MHLKYKNTNDLIDNIRNEFPYLDNTKRNLIYFDTAASSQKPRLVIESIKNTYHNSYANVHRGIYKLSQDATDKYENAREKVATFLNAKESKEIIFTRGATEGLNLIANCLAGSFLKQEDEIIISTLEHHSNIIPWQIACKKSGSKIIELKPDKNGNFSFKDIIPIISKKTKVISLPHVTNSIGSVVPLKEICDFARQNGIITVIDGCQAAPHLKIDVEELKTDFYVFSGHKIYGPSGIGALYGKKNLLEKLDPYQTGGEMIDYVSIQEATYSDIPHKFEAGTPNIEGAISLGCAIDFINEIEISNVTKHSKNLTDILLKELNDIKGVNIIGKPTERISIVSFTVDGAHPHDLALLLDNRGIAVRAGHHCAQPAMRHFKVDTTLRVSFGIYNNEKEIEDFLCNLNSVKKLF